MVEWHPYRTGQVILSHYTPSKQGLGNHGNIEVGMLNSALTLLLALYMAT